MARHLFTLVCQKASIDSDDNTVSIHQIIEEITLLMKRPEPVPESDGKQPAVPMSLCVFSEWMRSIPEAAEVSYMRVQLLPPTSHPRLGPVQKIDLTKHERLRTIVKSTLLPYTGPGYYRFIVESGAGTEGPWSQVADIPIKINVQIDDGDGELN